MDGLAREAHPDLVRQPVPFLEVAAQASRDHVRPRCAAASRARHDVIDRQALAPPVAVLAGVAVASKDVFLVEGDPVEESTDE